MTPIIAIANQKGGVGKTTTTNNLGKYLANKGFKVLLIDLDPQGNLSYTFTGKAIADEALILDIYDGKKIPPLNVINNLDLYCANSELTTISERGDNGYFQLKEGIEGIISEYDIVLIDCLPTLSTGLVSALVAATHVLIPAAPNDLSSQGLHDLIGRIQQIQRRMNANLDLLGLILTAVEDNTKSSKETELLIRNTYKNYVFSAKTRKSIDMLQSHNKENNSKDITRIVPKKPISQDFKEFAEEFINRLNLTTHKNIKSVG
ncbi:ParA family protein [Piscirickettsia litoralis]|uniref:AAA domain-containing protein n=1 Tax=Piscirickettsia litoralis TaxID=1891921 RepID=A0ABX2ZZ84_9GAMM|nr:ParA family protein [Piscirickettsia litoralis]ODN41538.1 hypothetical protein BGC07_15635 [Piscirickettsia litoralis]